MSIAAVREAHEALMNALESLATATIAHEEARNREIELRYARERLRLTYRDARKRHEDLMAREIGEEP